jgi:hypothetical protein
MHGIAGLPFLTETKRIEKDSSWGGENHCMVLRVRHIDRATPFLLENAMTRVHVVTALLATCFVFPLPAQAQVVLAPKFAAGQSFKSQETIKAVESIKLAGQTIEIKSDTSLRAKLNIQDGGGELKQVALEFESVIGRVGLPGFQVIEFDSTKPPAAEPADSFIKGVSELFSSLVGNKMVATFIGRKVIVVDGVSEKMPVTADEMKVELQQRFDPTPDHAVKPGDTWERTVELHIGGGQTLTFQRRYEYIGTTRSTAIGQGGKDLDELKATDLSALYTIRPNAQLPLTVKKSDLKVESSSHLLLFDRDLGRVVKSEGKVHLTGEVLFNAGAEEVGGPFEVQVESASEELK